MNIVALKPPYDVAQEKYGAKQLEYTQQVLAVLREKEGNQAVEQAINQHIETLNAFQGGPANFVKAMRKTRNHILQLVLKHLKLVPKNYYRTLWTTLGMSAIGLPIGTALGAALGNMGYLGIGLPIGISVGMAMGATMDKKAAKEGRQLAVEASAR